MQRLFTRYITLFGAFCLFANMGNAQQPVPSKKGKAPQASSAAASVDGGADALIPKEMDGYLSWKRFMKFDKSLWDLAGKPVKVQGYMFPLDQAEKQRHFILSVFPSGCPFCLPAGPEGMIEAFASKPIPFGFELIRLQGTIEFPEKDPMGLRYRLRNAELIK